MNSKLQESTEDACVRVMAKLEVDPQVAEALRNIDLIYSYGLGEPDFRGHMLLTLLGYVYWVGHADASIEHLKRMEATIPVKH